MIATPAIAAAVLAVAYIGYLATRIAGRIDSAETSRAATAWMRRTQRCDLVDAWETAGRPPLYGRRWTRAGLSEDHRISWACALLNRPDPTGLSEQRQHA